MTAKQKTAKKPKDNFQKLYLRLYPELKVSKDTARQRVAKALALLKAGRGSKIFGAYYFEGKTLKNVGEKYKLTDEGTRVSNKRIIRLLIKTAACRHILYDEDISSDIDATDSLSVLELDDSLLDMLAKNGITTVSELVSAIESDSLRRIQNVGPVKITRIAAAIKQRGIKLNPPKPVKRRTLGYDPIPAPVKIYQALTESFTMSEIANATRLNSVQILKMAQKDRWPYFNVKNHHGWTESRFPMETLPSEIRRSMKIETKKRAENSTRGIKIAELTPGEIFLLQTIRFLQIDPSPLAKDLLRQL